MKSVKELTYAEAYKAAKKFVYRTIIHAIIILGGVGADWYFCLSTVPNLSPNAADGCLIVMVVLTIAMLIMGILWIQLDFEDIKKDTYRTQRQIMAIHKLK